MKEKNTLKTRQSFDIADINELGMFYFSLWTIEQDRATPTLLISGHKGYAGYVVDIRFTNLVYVACASFIKDNFYWRLATEEETEEIRKRAGEPTIGVYCIEEVNVPKYFKQPQGVSPESAFLFNRPVRKYFIAAAGVEIRLSYSGQLEDRLSSWGQPV